MVSGQFQRAQRRVGTACSRATVGALVLIGGLSLQLPALRTPARAAASCVGDCNGNGAVTVNELIIGVNIALGSDSLDRCQSLDVNGGQVMC